MRSQLERAINLASRTGDKVIIVDELNDRSSVVMNLDDYERLLNSQNKRRNDIGNLTEDELLDNINHDITSWKNANSDRNFSSEIPSFRDSLDDNESFFAETTEDEDEFDDDELHFDDEDGEDEEEINTDIFPDFIADEKKEESEESFFAEAAEDESELMPEKAITEEPIIVETKADESVSATATVDEDENVYYYHEPEPEAETESELKMEPKSELAPESEPESTEVVEDKTEKQEETIKDANGFTSIKDELKKNKKAWAIPEEVKKSAEDVKE